MVFLKRKNIKIKSRRRQVRKREKKTPPKVKIRKKRADPGLLFLCFSGPTEMIIVTESRAVAPTLC
jgi:hypothetical protein